MLSTVGQNGITSLINKHGILCTDILVGKKNNGTTQVNIQIEIKLPGLELDIYTHPIINSVLTELEITGIYGKIQIMKMI